MLDMRKISWSFYEGYSNPFWVNRFFMANRLLPNVQSALHLSLSFRWFFLLSLVLNSSLYQGNDWESRSRRIKRRAVLTNAVRINVFARNDKHTHEIQSNTWIRWNLVVPSFLELVKRRIFAITNVHENNRSMMCITLNVSCDRSNDYSLGPRFSGKLNFHMFERPFTIFTTLTELQWNYYVFYDYS